MTSRLALPTSSQGGFPASLDRVRRLGGDRFGMVDRQSGRVVFFDGKGTFLGAAGRIGDGPGEFRFPADMAVLEDSSIVVIDPAAMRVTRLGPDGSFLGSFPSTRFAGRRVAALPQGRVVLGGINDTGEGAKLLAIYDTSGRLLATSIEAPDTLVQLTPRLDDIVLVATIDRLFVVPAAWPTVYTVYPDSVTSRSLALPRDVWHQLLPMTNAAKTPADIRAWVDSASILTAGGLSHDTVLQLAWHTGAAEGGRNRIVHVPTTESTAGLLLDGVPGWVLALQDNSVWVLAEQGADTNVVQVYRCQ